ncbi:MAG: thioredoxin family protein [Armatimonadetes bacterium]|nr:thioredoxin family protein [Armatimonadota bacterium]
MKIQILGVGCPKCKALTENVEKAVKQAGIDAEIEKVTQITEIAKFGIMMTPGLAIDGKVVSAGKVLGPDEIVKLLKA